MTGTWQPGTPGYMSPEHVRSEARPLPASDIFSVGILLYRVLAGGVPIAFNGDLADYASRLKNVKLRPLHTVRSGLPEEAYELVARCLHPQVARRFLNGAELQTAVEKIECR